MIILINLPQYTYSFHVINRGYDINRGHCLKRVVINIRASKNISGLVKIQVTSPAGLMNFFLNVEPCFVTAFEGGCRNIMELCKHLKVCFLVILAQNWFYVHAQLMLAIRFLSYVIDTRALIGPCHHVTLC